MTGRFRAAQWSRLVRGHFDFLIGDFGFQFRSVDESSNWLTRASYVSATTEIDVDDSEEFGRVEVQLVRLVDGVAPPYPIFVSTTPVLHHFMLDHVLMERAPGELAALRPRVSYETGQADDALEAWSLALQRYADDILRGDFTLFPKLEAAIRETVRQNPDGITVWLPREKEADQSEVDRLRATFPGISVKAKQYARPPRVSKVRALMRRLLGGR